MTSLVSKLPHGLHVYLSYTWLIGGVYGGWYGNGKDFLITGRNIVLGAAACSILYPFVPFIVLGVDYREKQKKQRQKLE